MVSVEKKTILLVEDETLIAMYEKTILERVGYKVIHVCSGEEAVEIFKNNNTIDLILMDINLGGSVDGTEAAENILKEREIPVVFLSSHTEPEIVEKTEKITSYGYILKNSEITILDASIKMAFKLFEANKKIKNELHERKRVEKALRASEKKQHKLLQDLDQKLQESEYQQLWNVYAQSRVPTFTIDKSGNIINFNNAMAKLTGYTHNEVPNFEKLILHTCPDESYRQELIKIRQMSLKKEINPDKEIFTITTKEGKTRYIIISIYDIMHQNQLTDLQVIQCEDITEQKKIEKILIENELKYMTLFKSMDQGFYLADIIFDENGNPCDYKYVDVNSAFEQIIGLTQEQIIGKTYNELVPPDPESGWPDCFKRVVITGTPENYTFLSKIYNCYFEVYAFKPGEGKFAALVKDITDRILAEEKIKKLLNEKELLLKKVHHRIKNNMNIIYSLLEFQSNIQMNAESKKALQDTSSRIQSMKVLYDKLYNSTNYGQLSIKDYLSSLIYEITKIFSNLSSIQINTDFDNIIFDEKKLSSIGLIINELITNAMKFAFIGRNDGIINISVTTKNNHIFLIIEDNGIGLPEHITIKNSTGFGMHLVGVLVEQINGTINISRQNGTKYTIEFEE